MLTAYSGSSAYLIDKICAIGLPEDVELPSQEPLATPPSKEVPIIPLTIEQKRLFEDLYRKGDVFRMAYSQYGNVLRNRGIDRDGAQSLAAMAMASGIQTYDPTMSTTLKTHLVNCVIYYWKTHQDEEAPSGGGVYVPRNLKPLTYLFKQTREQLEQQLNRNVDDETVIAEMEKNKAITEKDKSKLLDAVRGLRVTPVSGMKSSTDVVPQDYHGLSDNIRKDRMGAYETKEEKFRAKQEEIKAKTAYIIALYVSRLERLGGSSKKQADALRLAYGIDLDNVDERIKPFIAKYDNLKHNKAKMVGKILFDAGVIRVKEDNPIMLETRIRNNASRLLEKGYHQIGEFMEQEGISTWFPFASNASQPEPLTALMGSSRYFLKW